jgi:hypothetical protein
MMLGNEIFNKVIADILKIFDGRASNTVTNHPLSIPN